MQVGMLNPSNAAKINQETCPVRIDITDRGFPEGIRALRWHERALARDPFIRRRFGHFTLIDPWGQELLGVAYGTEGIPHLEEQITQFRETASQRRLAGEPSPQPIDDPDEVLAESLQQGPLSLQWMTAYDLGFDHWLEIVDVFANSKRLAPGVRNAAIHAFGEYADSESSPYNKKNALAVSVLISEMAGRPPKENTATPSPDNWDLRERAAYALIRIANLPIDSEDADFVAQVRAWWSDHQNDAEFEIAWSDDPRLRYSFYQ